MNKRELPAEDPTRLGAQLVEAFKALVSDGGKDDVRRAHALLDALSHDLLRAASRADLDWERAIAEALEPVEALIDDHLDPTVPAPQVLLARLLQLMEGLDQLVDVGAPRLARQEVERSSSLRQVMCALSLYPERYARRGQVAKDVEDLSDSRVGQLLLRLHGLGFADRMMETARGGTIPFYRLNSAGLALCAELSPQLSPQKPLLERWVEPQRETPKDTEGAFLPTAQVSARFARQVPA